MDLRRKNKFDVDRRRGFARAKCQAAFRFEEWNLTWTDWCAFWPTQSIWSRRGRDRDSLCLTRRDYTKPWDRDNCCLLPRQNVIGISNKKNNGIEYEYLFNEAIYLKDVKNV